ncbi:MAG: leucine--tRNA ligase [Candidatus Latescibacteria bacterium]|nr:leucine--tRNA ligase [Candidatus Latescibacterota bacterium]
MTGYDFKTIEPKWQAWWEEQGLHRTGTDPKRPKFYCLDFFPYPSGEGLSVGHCRNYIPTDLIARYKRMRGYNVLHPMGWDAFGEPSEAFAIKHGIHPRLATTRNTANYKRQLRLIGTSYDWSREIDSSDPEYYQWTQSFFLLLYHRGLAYRDTNWQWWCPQCQTTLSNQEVGDGVCWRGHNTITKKLLPAWFFRITAYADRLISDLDGIDWPERITTMQRNWVGRSEGVEFDMEVAGTNESIRVFTTRVDTVFGVSFVVLAPEHPLVDALTTPEHRAAVEAYRDAARLQTDIERASIEREQTGVFTGAYAINPVNGQRVPLYLADYVLMGYGTGAIMAVPAHDARDFGFATRYGLPIPVVIAPPEWDGQPLSEASTGDGVLVNCGEFSGLPSRDGLERIADWMEHRGIGRRQVHYKMRDWLISRQRFWGAPIPIVHCVRCGMVPVPEDELPVLLPDRYQPATTGRSPLADIPEFVQTTCPGCGGPAERETDTMGGFACSSWYFLRFTSPHEHARPFDPEAVAYWMPVDVYVGGAEHAVMHLLYARFWMKVMADAGLVPFSEPFAKLLNQGQLHAPSGQRMSKSRGNVITPDSVVEEYGADTLRLYELFMAPFDEDATWSEEGINGTSRFLNRVWALVMKNLDTQDADSPELIRRRHLLVKQVSEGVEECRFNTTISRFMEFVNYVNAPDGLDGVIGRSTAETVLILLAPFAPHLTEELWHALGHADSVHQQGWPDYDPALLVSAEMTLVLQVNGKVRGQLTVAADADEETIRRLALEHERVRPYLDGHGVKRVVVVPKKLVNIVV